MFLITCLGSGIMFYININMVKLVYILKYVQATVGIMFHATIHSTLSSVCSLHCALHQLRSTSVSVVVKPQLC